MLKSTGIVRKVDELGRIVLPKELRFTMKINEKDPLEIYTDGQRIVLQKYQPGCIICGEYRDDLVNHAGKEFCPSCIRVLMTQAKLDQMISQRKVAHG